MPELAEVEFYRKQWSPGISKMVKRVHVHPDARIFREADPEIIQKQLKGKLLLDSHAHGKKLLFCFSGDIWLGIHLGMSGSMQVTIPEMVPARHDHLVLKMDSCTLVLMDPRMFGKVLFHQGKESPVWWSNLPAQPQDEAFDKAYFLSILKRFPRKSLKGLLLEQEVFPGIGNWMADEILWQARIHPALTGGELTSYRKNKLFACIKSVCEISLKIIGTEWGDPPETWLFQNRWKRGGICPVSGKPLEYETIAGRTTCFSPAIQK